MRVLELAAQLRDLTGFEEEWIAGEAAAARGVAAACHELLARCLGRPGNPPPKRRGEVCALGLAERDWLLLELRRRSLGGRLRSEVRCPACGSSAEVEFSVGDLPLQPVEPPPNREVRLPGGGSAVLRPLTAADHEAFAAERRLDAASRTLAALSRVIVSLDSKGLNDAKEWKVSRHSKPAGAAELTNLSPEDLAALEQALDAASPEELRLDLRCPDCAQPLAAPFEVCSFVFAELRQHSATLLDDVHALARAYHWSERDILRLPLRRRLAYLMRIEAEQDAALVRAGEARAGELVS